MYTNLSTVVTTERRIGGVERHEADTFLIFVLLDLF